MTARSMCPVGMVHLKDIALRYGFKREAGGFSAAHDAAPAALRAALDADRCLADQDADRPHATWRW
jgi:hypothetical protein